MQVFFCKVCEIFKDTFFIEHLRCRLLTKRNINCELLAKIKSDIKSSDNKSPTFKRVTKEK